jgi:F-type H+-transporting ATPase subunit epsilon
MILEVLLPTKILLEQKTNKITAEAENGSFGLLPNHIDFVSLLVPGILSFETEEGEERFLAVDTGVLVKRGQRVLVSVGQAFGGEDLQSLEQTVAEEFLKLDDREKQARSATVKLEAGFIRGVVERAR